MDNEDPVIPCQGSDGCGLFASAVLVRIFGYASKTQALISGSADQVRYGRVAVSDPTGSSRDTSQKRTSWASIESFGGTSHRTIADCKRHSTENDLKAFLREMVVVGQDCRYSVASHSRHGDAVDKAVALVITLLVQTQAR